MNGLLQRLKNSALIGQTPQLILFNHPFNKLRVPRRDIRLFKWVLYQLVELPMFPPRWLDKLIVLINAYQVIR